MGNTYMPKPENRYPNNVSGFEHIWELDMLMPQWLKLNFFVCVLFFLNHIEGMIFVSCQSKSTGTCHLSWHCVKDKMSNEFFMLILWEALFPE